MGNKGKKIKIHLHPGTQKEKIKVHHDCTKFFFPKLRVTIFRPGEYRRSRKWWQTILEEGISCSKGEGWTCIRGVGGNEGQGGWVIFCFSSSFNLCPCNQPTRKTVTNRFGNQKYMQATGRVNHALKVHRFYFLWIWGWERGFFFIFLLFSTCSFYVLFKFPMSSH